MPAPAHVVHPHVIEDQQPESADAHPVEVVPPAAERPSFAGNWVLDAQASRLDVKDSPNDTTLLAARVMYNLSRRTAVYATVGHVSNRGTATVAVDAGGTIGAGMSQSGIMTGVRHFF